MLLLNHFFYPSTNPSCSEHDTRSVGVHDPKKKVRLIFFSCVCDECAQFKWGISFLYNSARETCLKAKRKTYSAFKQAQGHSSLYNSNSYPVHFFSFECLIRFPRKRATVPPPLQLAKLSDSSRTITQWTPLPPQQQPLSVFSSFSRPTPRRNA